MLLLRILICISCIIVCVCVCVCACVCMCVECVLCVLQCDCVYVFRCCCRYSFSLTSLVLQPLYLSPIHKIGRDLCICLCIFWVSATTGRNRVAIFNKRASYMKLCRVIWLHITIYENVSQMYHFQLRQDFPSAMSASNFRNIYIIQPPLVGCTYTHTHTCWRTVNVVQNLTALFNQRPRDCPADKGHLSLLPRGLLFCDKHCTW